MRLLTFSAENLPRESWSVLTRNSIYASPEFARLWRPMNGRERFFICEPIDNPPAGMAGVVFGRCLLKRFQSMPDGLKGGPFFSKECDETDKRKFMAEIFFWLKSNSFIRADIHNSDYDFNIEGFQRRETKTHILDLFGDNFKPLSGKVRKHIRTGKRRGATIAMMHEKKPLDDIYDLAIKTAQRHNKRPKYSRQFLGELLKISADNDRILWPAVFADDKIIGSRICFIDQGRLLTWQYYSDKKYSHLKPGYLLLDYIINYAQDNNIKIIDMGWSPPDALSLIDYKEQWGGIAGSCSGYTYYNWLGKILYRWK